MLKWLLCLCVLHIFGQNTLRPNININAKELSHTLNNTKDTLCLSSQFNIESVVILNGSTTATIPVNGLSCKISLNEIAEGKNVIVVRTNKKLIVFQILNE